LGDDKSYVELGAFYDIIYHHNELEKLEFEIEESREFIYHEFDEENGIHKTDYYKEPFFNFKAQIIKEKERVKVNSFRYSQHEFFAYTKNLNLKEGDTRSEYEVVSNESSNDGKIYHTQVENAPGKFYLFPINQHTIVSQSASEMRQWFVSKIENLFNDIYYLGPLREYPNRFYSWSGEQTQSVGNRGERAIAALLSSRQEGPTIWLAEGQPPRTVEEHVAHWLKELGLIYSFKVQPIAPNRKEYEVRIQRTAESASVFLTDVGFGVSQILPVLVLLFYVPEGSTVILEQPEIHLHPAVQAGLADVFIDAIKRRKVQIILESHSEHLLQRLQRRIAEEVINQEEIKLYFTSIEKGKSNLTTLELDEYGNISNWPAGFFGDAFAEAAAKMKAEMKRKMQKQ